VVRVDIEPLPLFFIREINMLFDDIEILSEVCVLWNCDEFSINVDDSVRLLVGSMEVEDEGSSFSEFSQREILFMICFAESPS